MNDYDEYYDDDDDYCYDDYGSDYYDYDDCGDYYDDYDYYYPEEPTLLQRVKMYFVALWWRVSSKFQKPEIDDIPF